MNTSSHMDVEDLEVYKNSYAEWIGENIGAESSRARTPLAISRGIGSVWRK